MEKIQILTLCCFMRYKNKIMSYDEFIETKAIDKHCSYCRYFWSYPKSGQMYCTKLQKKITARKKACKYFKR